MGTLPRNPSTIHPQNVHPIPAGNPPEMWDILTTSTLHVGIALIIRKLVFIASLNLSLQSGYSFYYSLPQHHNCFICLVWSFPRWATFDHLKESITTMLGKTWQPRSGPRSDKNIAHRQVKETWKETSLSTKIIYLLLRFVVREPGLESQVDHGSRA